MADILIDNQTAPTTPASSKSVLWVDSTTKKQAATDDSGVHRGILSHNQYLGASFTSSAADTYVTNSGLLIPSFGFQVGMMAQWICHVSKTAAGTTGAVVTVRLGSAQTTADTSILAMTQVTAQAAVLNDGQLWVTVYPTVVSASGIFSCSWGTTGGTTGWGSGKSAQSGTADNTGKAGLFLGISVNSNTSAVWTFTGVWARLYQ